MQENKLSGYLGGVGRDNNNYHGNSHLQENCCRMGNNLVLVTVFHTFQQELQPEVSIFFCVYSRISYVLSALIRSFTTSLLPWKCWASHHFHFHRLASFLISLLFWHAFTRKTWMLWYTNSHSTTGWIMKRVLQELITLLYGICVWYCLLVLSTCRRKHCRILNAS